MDTKSKKQKLIKKKERRSFHKKYFHGIIVFLFSFFLFTNSIPNGYNLDDELVTNNHRLTSKGISAISEIFTSSYYKDDMGYAYEYRPVVLSSFAIEHQLFGDNPNVSHFFNVLLYSICCVLAFYVLNNICNLPTPTFPFIVALLFVAHSSHTEVVSSIKNRDEILGLIFCFLTFLLALQAVNKAKWFLVMPMPVVFSFALMSKVTFLPFAVIIPMALVLFTEANLSTLLIISFSFALPSFFLINTGNFADKVFISSGIAVTPLFLFLFFKFQPVVQFLKRAKARISESSVRQQTVSEDSEAFKGFNGFFTNLNPPFLYFSFYPMAGTFFLGLNFFIGVVYSIPVLEVIVLAILFLLVWKGNEEWSWWANILIFFCLALSILGWRNNLLINLVSIYLSYQVFFGKSVFRVPAIIALLLSIVFDLYIFFNVYLSIIYPLLFAALRTRIRWPVAIFCVITTVASLFASESPSFNNIMWYYDTRAIEAYAKLLLLVPLVFSTLLFRKASVYLKWSFVLIAFAVLVLYQISRDNSPPLKIKNRVEMLGKDVNLTINTEDQDRPITFIEQPVSPNDSWQIKAGTSMRILFHYFLKTIIPYPLAFYYGYKFIGPEEITNPIPLLSLFIYSIIIFLFYFFRSNQLISFGIGIYLISILTFSNYFAPIPGIVGDRYILIPSLGWSIVLAFILFKAWKVNVTSHSYHFSKIPKGFKYTFGFILCFYSAITFSRNFQWKDSLTLFRHDINYVDQSAMAHNLLAIHLMRASEIETNLPKQTELRKEALVHFKKSQEIYPKFYNVAYDIGRVYLSLNMQDSAIHAFKHAIQIGSTYIMVYKNLAELLFSKGRYEEAIPYLEYIIKESPKEFSFYDKLSYIYFKRKDYLGSIAINKKAIQQLPQQIDPVFNIGRTYLAINELDSARYYLLRANEMSPGNTVVQQLLQQTGSR